MSVTSFQASLVVLSSIRSSIYASKLFDLRWSLSREDTLILLRCVQNSPPCHSRVNATHYCSSIRFLSSALDYATQGPGRGRVPFREECEIGLAKQSKMRIKQRRRAVRRIDRRASSICGRLRSGGHYGGQVSRTRESRVGVCGAGKTLRAKSAAGALNWPNGRLCGDQLARGKTTQPSLLAPVPQCYHLYVLHSKTAQAVLDHKRWPICTASVATVGSSCIWTALHWALVLHGTKRDNRVVLSTTRISPIVHQLPSHSYKQGRREER